MKMIDKYNEVKKKFGRSIILIKCGIFYETLNDDAYIMRYLFNYKIKKSPNFIMVGFPEKIVESIKDRLKGENISYVILDDNQQFTSDMSSSTESKYEILLDRSCKSYTVVKEIERIIKALDVLKDTKSIDEIISKIKEII